MVTWMNKPKQNGFTMLELLITLSIAVILAAMAIPSMATFIATLQSDNYANSLHQSISLARSESIKRGVNVTVCVRNTDGDDCSTAVDAAWDDGWLVIEDSTIVLQQAALPSAFTINADTSTAFSGLSIVYTPLGTTANNGRLVLCRNGVVDKNTKSIELSLSGAVRVRGNDRISPAQCYG